MSKIVIEVKLSDEDRALLKSVKAAASGNKGDGDDAGDGDAGDGDGDAGDGDGDGDASGLGDDAGDGDGDGDDKPTRDNVRDALRAYAKQVKSQDKAVALMKKVGGTDALSKLKEAKFAAVITAANAATKAAKKS